MPLAVPDSDWSQHFLCRLVGDVVGGLKTRTLSHTDVRFFRAGRIS